MVLEDYLWFVLNPAYGMAKFKRKYVTWHQQWIGIIPRVYLIGIFLGLLLFFGSSYL
ncbi:MAG TPA: hypothetical protein VJG66_04160 [Patescibacteria group bacterium]|nr:hypothetical protein [Patescibacteria group bacterium]